MRIRGSRTKIKPAGMSNARLTQLAQELGLMSKHPGKYQCSICGKWLSVRSNRGHRCK